MKTFHVHDIQWECDGHDVTLPSEYYIEIENAESMSEEEIEEVLSDEITEKTGWLNNGFVWEEYLDDGEGDEVFSE